MKDFLKPFICIFVILIECQSKVVYENIEEEAKYSIQESITNVNKTDDMLPKAQRGQGVFCTEDSDCDVKGLLLCIRGKCQCPGGFNHDQVLDLIQEHIKIPQVIPDGITTKFYLDSIWEESSSQCVGKMDSFCIVDNLPDEIRSMIPFRSKCDPNILGCGPYSERELQGVFGTCGSGASQIFLTSVLILSSLLSMVLL